MEAEERPVKKRKLSHDGAMKVKEERIESLMSSHGNGESVTVDTTVDEADQRGKFASEDVSLPTGSLSHAKTHVKKEYAEHGLEGFHGDQAVKAEHSSSDRVNHCEETSSEASPLQQGQPVKVKAEPETALEDSIPLPSETAPLAEAESSALDGPSLSKNQLKKLRKKQEWESKRGERKLARKEKLVAKRERKRAGRQQEGDESATAAPAPVLKRPPVQKPVQLPVTFLIDCDFDDLMRDNERISLASQITRSYSDNKNSMLRAHLTVCSFNGKLRERFDNVLDHYHSWKGVRFLDCDFVDAAVKAKAWMRDEEEGGKLAGSLSHFTSMSVDTQALLKEEGEVVYLTSESNETLTELKPYSTYIIGGLVDKNREKGICYKRARQRGVRTARLPIGEFMEMQSRKVLATNHVNEIMLKWLECGDWGQAFLKAIPKRKGGKLKGPAEEGEDEAEEGTNGGGCVEGVPVGEGKPEDGAVMSSDEGRPLRKVGFP